MVRTKTNKEQLWEELIDLIWDKQFTRTTILDNNIMTGERFTAIDGGNKILIEALGFFSGQHKTITMNSITIDRIKSLIKMIKKGRNDNN